MRRGLFDEKFHLNWYIQRVLVGEITTLKENEHDEQDLLLMWSVYDKDHISELQIENRSEPWSLARSSRASHRYRGGHGFESRWSLNIFLGFICNYLSYFTTAKISFTSKICFWWQRSSNYYLLLSDCYLPVSLSLTRVIIEMAFLFSASGLCPLSSSANETKI